MITIKDIAARANVSFQLVSAVLGDKSYAHASDATRQKIKQAAEELGYMPNVSARVLQGGSSKLLGVMIDSQAPEVVFSMLAELESVATQHGYQIMIAQAHNKPGKLVEAYRILKQNGVDGFISLVDDYPNETCQVNDLLKGEHNLVSIGHHCLPGLSYVKLDIGKGIQQAIRHLQAQGYERIALLISSPQAGNSLPYLSVQKRADSFLKHAPAGVIYRIPDNMTSLNHVETAIRQQVMPAIQRDRVDAIIAKNDYWAALVQRIAFSCGLRVPQNLGIVGCDNRPLCLCTSATLTSLGYDMPKIAYKVVDFLLGYLPGKTTPLHTTIHPVLFVRESSQRNGNSAIQA